MNGLEIWNFLADWVDNFSHKSALKSFFFRHHILNGPTASVLEWWDRLNNSVLHIVPAIGGSDAHALKYRFLGIIVKIFPYVESFKAVTNHIYLDKELSKDFDEAKSQIYIAIKKGNNLIENRAWNSTGKMIEFCIETPDSRIYAGNSLKNDNQSKILIKTPEKAKIRLIHNGKLVQEVYGKELIYAELSSGKYRVEIFRKNHPWVFSNPIMVE